MPFGVTRRQAALTRLNPDLQKVQRLGSRRIKLAVSNARTRTHELDLSWFQLSSVAHAVLVLQCAFQHVAENFHIPVRMLPKALGGCDAVVVDNPQWTETHVSGVVIVGEGEGVERIE